MKAIAHFKCLPIEHPDALVEIDIPEPVPGPRDLLVEVRPYRSILSIPRCGRATCRTKTKASRVSSVGTLPAWSSRSAAT